MYRWIGFCVVLMALGILAPGAAQAASCPVSSIAMQYNSTGSTVSLDVVDDGTGSGNCRLSGDLGSIGGILAQLDPCERYPHQTTTVSLSGAGTVKISGTAGKQTYLCFAGFPNQPVAVNMAIVEGTGTNCATGIHALTGGTTTATGINIPQGAGFIEGVGGFAIMWTATAGDDVCFTSSAALAGSAVSVQQ